MTVFTHRKGDSMAKKNLRERLLYRKIKKPNPFVARLVILAFQFLAWRRKTAFEYGPGVSEYRNKQIILLSQHCSRDEYIYTIAGFPRTDVHCVIGYQNFFQKYVYYLLLRLGAIAKYLYQSDFIAVRHMLRVVKEGRSLLLFPEGIQSTSGSTHPINPTTVHLLVKCRLPVILCTSHGSYLTRPRYSAKKRIGRMVFSYQLLFRPEDFDRYTEEALYQRLLSAFSYNEFAYNRQARVPFRGKCENIEGLDNIIYKCPHCAKEFGFLIEGKRMHCTGCGYAVEMDAYYDLHPVNIPLYFQDIDEWYRWQRAQVRAEVRQAGFSISCPVRVYDLNLDKLKNAPDEVGTGTLTIRDHEIAFCGLYKKEPACKLVFDIRKTPSFPFSPADHSVELYYENQYYCFAPLEQPLQVVKWMLAVEEIHNHYDPAWGRVSRDVYE